jgi:hypothetical protein
MIAIMRGITKSRTLAVSDLCCDGVCRGMLQGTPRGEAGGVHGLAAAGGSGEHSSERDAAERRGYTDASTGAIPSRTEAAGEGAWE